MRIADPQQRQPGCSENILRLECRHGRLSQSFHIPSCGRPIKEQTEVRACSRVIMIFWLSRPLDLTLVLHIVDLLGYPRGWVLLVAGSTKPRRRSSYRNTSDRDLASSSASDAASLGA